MTVYLWHRETSLMRKKMGLMMMFMNELKEMGYVEYMENTWSKPAQDAR